MLLPVLGLLLLGAIVVDLAGPASVVVEGDVLAHLGEGHRLVELVDGGFGWVVLSD